ncbi:MAG: hypothetical protein GOU99_00405 [Candidatus Altiarchaeota archaeon]|nr:hypothetical protein [Candidatus Altiarchaeota archaeon]
MELPKELSLGGAVLSGAMLITGFLLIQSGLFSAAIMSPDKTILIGIGFLAVFSSLALIAGISHLNLVYFLPLLLLSLFSIMGFGLFAYAVLVARKLGSLEKNIVKTNLTNLAGVAYGLPYLILIGLMVWNIYPALSFQIPDQVADFVVEFTEPVSPCPLDMTGIECVDYLVDSYTERQCGTDTICINIINSQKDILRTQMINEMKLTIPDFSEDSTVRDSMRATVVDTMNNMITPYQDELKIVAAVLVFLSMEFIGRLLQGIASILSTLGLRAMVSSKLIKEKTIKVDKTVYSI